MSRLLVLVVALAWLPSAGAATHGQRCAKYAAELARIDRAIQRGGSNARMHKLESERQKVLAGQARHRC